MQVQSKEMKVVLHDVGSRAVELLAKGPCSCKGSREAWMDSLESYAVRVIKEGRHMGLHKFLELKSVEICGHVRKLYASPVHLPP